MEKEEDEIVENGLCESVSDHGSLDVSSCTGSEVASADHLVVMVNGILGSVNDWKFAAERFVRMLPDKVVVHCSERNVSSHTLDGVDVMGERLANEIDEVMKSKPNLRKISIIAHSVGGLVARYVIGKLYKPPKLEPAEPSLDNSFEEDSRATICGLEAMNFITVATPHLGSRGNKQVPFLFGLTALEKTATFIIHLIFRRTGRHLFLTDNDDGKPPLLKRLIEDCHEYPFMSALSIFKRRVIYSNACFDHIVGWRTASIRRNCDLPRWEFPIDEKYPHVVHEEYCKAYDEEQCETVKAEDNGIDTIEDELLIGLSRMSWEKIDVSFHTSVQRFAAHSVIQVKDEVSHSEGADVIQHMIDHFVL